MKQLVRNLIIGKDRYIESWPEFKQVMLSGQYIIISILSILIYLSIDIFLLNSFSSTPIFIVGLFPLLAAWYQHRRGHHCEANYFLFPSLLILVFIISASEPAETGSFILFIPIVLGSFAVFDYKMRMVPIFIAVTAYVFFMISYFTEFTLLPQQKFSAEENTLNLILNFTIAFPTSILSIYLLIRLNHYHTLQLLDHNRSLKKNNQELDRFVYGTSHDLRAPLLSILGLIELTQSEKDQHLSNHYLMLMKTRIDSLQSFIKEITDFALNNRQQVLKEEVNLMLLLQEIWDNHRFASEAAGIDFQISIPANLVVETDKNRLKIVLNNLVSNAIRYHDARKENKFIKVSHQATAQSFSIMVEDNGLGIAPEYQKKVFNMFYRANESSKGSGLGLYIVKETLVKISGSIDLKSSPKDGTLFTVTVPVRVVAA